MKKIFIISGLLLLLALSAKAGVDPDEQQLTAWDIFNEAHQNAWFISWDENGLPKTIYNGKTDPDPGDPQTIALDFLNSLKDVYELNDVYQDLEFDQTRITQIDTIILKHVDYKVQVGQYHVFETRISVHMNDEGQIYMVTGRSSRVSLPVDYTQPLLTEDQAMQIALDSIEQPVNLRADSTADLGYLLYDDMHSLCYQIVIPTQEPYHDWLVYVDQSGQVLKKRDLIVNATGLANVYLTNPTEGSPVEVSLLRLDGTHYLRGDYSDVYYNWEADRAYESDDDFRYDVANLHFDEANVYYHMHKIQSYLPTQGFAGAFQMNSSVRIFVTWPDDYCDNAFYSPSSHETGFGKGCDLNDFAQEAAIIYHEFGHYVEHYQLDPSLHEDNFWNYEEYHEAGAISEGIADYFACSFTNDPIYCEWACANEPGYMRNLDNTLQYSDTTGEPHDDGQIIGGAVWKTRYWMLQVIGEWPHPDMIVLAALPHCQNNSDFKDFWINMVKADRQIALSDNLYAIDVGFTDRGFIAPENTEPQIIEGPFFVGDPPEIIEGGVYEVKVRAAQTGYPDGSALDYVWSTSSGGEIGEIWPPDTLVNYTALECPGPAPCYDAIHVNVYDGLGGWHQASLGPFEVKLYEPGGGGCPFLYVWNGMDFEEDNTILAESEINPGEPVIDYYLLSKPLVPTNDEYRLQIREFENEVSYIDRVRLVAVDHRPEIKVAVTPQGKIFGYDKELVPVACIDQNGRDHLSKIKSKDGFYFTSEEPGYLVITYSIRTLWPNVLYDPPPIEGNSGQPPWQKRAGVASHVMVEIEDANGDWQELGEVPPRFYPDRSLWILGTDNVELGQEFKVRLSWDAYYAADELKYYIRTKEQPMNVWSHPVSAVNSEGRKILAKIFNTDGEYATLMPGQTVELSFRVLSYPEPEMVRDFVLQTTGYYISLKKPSVLPNSFALLHNYPNPFNASTVIVYTLPQVTDVKLEIFNLLGQRVRVLVNQHQSAGYKNVVWDGKDDKGVDVSSGVYFYRLATKDYSDSKKMVLMR